MRFLSSFQALRSKRELFRYQEFPPAGKQLSTCVLHDEQAMNRRCHSSKSQRQLSPLSQPVKHPGQRHSCAQNQRQTVTAIFDTLGIDRSLQGLSTFLGEPANTVVLDSPACSLKLRANPKVLQRLPGSALEWHLLRCQWALSAGNALHLATSSPREKVVEPHVNNAFGDDFYSRNLF